MALAIGQRFGDYEVISELGRGGMGAVYRARQLSLQRIVALKILPLHVANDAAMAARFETEAVAAASLNHPNLVQVFAAGEHDGIRFIAMECVEGETIGHRVKRCGRLPITESLDVAYHVATALDHAWQTAQLVHRDVKPDNIFLATNGTVKLGDFGIAKFLREGASSVTLTGHVMGSPHFISPEQAHGQRDVDFRADIYSLGCALHYMMTGRMVFEGPDFVSIVLKHVNEEPAPLEAYLPDAPASLQRLLARMLSKDRAERPQSYAELIGQILLARDEVAVWETNEPRRRRPTESEGPAARSSRGIYAVAVLVPFLIAGGYVYSKLREQPRASRNIVTLSDASDRRDFVQRVAQMAPLDRIEAVIAKLREVNPAFKGRERFTVEGDAIIELALSGSGVTNIWPVTALQHLIVFHCTGEATNHVRGDLTDLSALAELKELVELDVSWNAVRDLSPLTSVSSLRILRCANTRVEDLAPIARLDLTELDITANRIRDLKPLAAMPLIELRCNGTRADLTPLKGAPLKMLWCDVRRLDAELVKSWKRIELINDQSPAEAVKRLGSKSR